MWWLTLIMALSILTVLELAYKTCKRLVYRAEIKLPLAWLNRRPERIGDHEIETWQEMEQDPEIRERLKSLAGP